MVKKFSIEEVPEENNIPLEPLHPASVEVTRETNSTPEDPLLSKDETQESPTRNEPLPTICVTTANGDHVFTRIKVSTDDEGDYQVFVSLFVLSLMI